MSEQRNVNRQLCSLSFGAASCHELEDDEKIEGGGRVAMECPER